MRKENQPYLSDESKRIPSITVKASRVESLQRSKGRHQVCSVWRLLVQIGLGWAHQTQRAYWIDLEAFGLLGLVLSWKQELKKKCGI